MNLQEAHILRSEARELIAQASKVLSEGASEQSIRSATDLLYEAIRKDPGLSDPHWHLAELYMRCGDCNNALECYLVALRLDPTLQDDDRAAAHVYGNLGRLYETRGSVDEAVRIYSRYLCFYPLGAAAPAVAERLMLLTDGAGHWMRSLQSACRLQADSDHEGAIQWFREALQQYPESSSIHHLFAISLRQQGYHDEAVNVLERAIGLDPHSRSFVEMGLTYAMIGNPYVEESFYERALQADADDPYVHYLLGMAAYGRKDRDHAVERLQRALALAPDALWAASAGNILSELMQAGDVGVPPCLRTPVEWRRWQKELEGIDFPYPAKAVAIPNQADDLVAFADAAEAPAGKPESRPFHFRLRCRPVPEHFELESFLRLTESGMQSRTAALKLENKERSKLCGLTMFRTERRDTQTDHMVLSALIFRGDEIVEFWFRSPWAVYRLVHDSYMFMIDDAKLLTFEQMHQARKKQYEMRATRQPGDWEALTGLGCALSALGDLNGAQDFLQKALKLQPTNNKVMLAMARCWLRSNKPDRAVAVLSRATDADVECLRTLGTAYERNRQPDKAVKAYQKALESGPDVNIIRQLAASYDSLQKYDMAERELKKAIGLDDKDPYLRLQLASVYRRSRQIQEAITLCKDALSLDSKSVSGNLLLGLVYMDASYWDMAQKQLHQVIALDYDNQTARAALDQIQVEKRKLRRF